MAYQLFHDGFGSYGTGATGLTLNQFGYSCYGGGPQFATMSSTGRRAGSKCLNMSNSFYFNLRKPINPASHVVAGMALKQVNSAGAIGVQFCEGDTVHAQLSVPAIGQPTVAVGGAAAVTAANSLVSNVWNYFELGVRCADAGGSYELRVNGTSVGWLPPTSADTRNGGTGVINNVRVYSTADSGFMQDLYIASGDELAWFGDARMDPVLLAANGTPMDWVPSTGNAWERLNAGDGYVASSVDEATALFAPAALGYTPSTIHSLALRGLVQKSDAGSSRGAATLIKSDATEIESAELTLSTDALGIAQMQRLNPATGQAWTPTALSAARVGLRVKT